LILIRELSNIRKLDLRRDKRLLQTIYNKQNI